MFYWSHGMAEHIFSSRWMHYLNSEHTTVNCNELKVALGSQAGWILGTSDIPSSILMLNKNLPSQADDTDYFVLDTPCLCATCWILNKERTVIR